MKIPVFLGILGATLVTGAFVLALAGGQIPNPLHDAVNPTVVADTKDAAPPVPRSEMDAAGCHFEMLTDKTEYQPGDSPVLTLAARNLTNRSVETNVQLQILAMAPPSPLSRVMPMPQAIWAGGCLVNLAPGETRSFALKADTELVANRLLTVTMASGDRKAQLDRIKVADAGTQQTDAMPQISSSQSSSET